MRSGQWSNFWSNYDNVLPGRWRGVKRGEKGKIKPSKYPIMMERNPGLGSWYTPFKPKPIKRRERRRQAKPRG